MDLIEVKLLQYTFKFRQLSWREEFDLKPSGDRDHTRTVLARALEEISPLKVTSLEEANRVLDAIPTTIIRRVFIIYRGGLPVPRSFNTMGLYQAPEPLRIRRQFMEDEKARSEILDRVEQEMAAKFGSRELAEAREVERQILKGAKRLNVVRATPDPSEDGDGGNR